MTKRLRMVAGLVHKNTECIADIGCDHCYTSIYLIQHGIAQKVIACDINKGPLEIGNKNIIQSGLVSKIETRMGNGLSIITPGEIDCALISGMGGKLICSILDESTEVVKNLEQLVLQPQRDIGYVRKFLHSKAFRIEHEDMVYEDGKYYTAISAVAGQEQYDEHEYELGRILVKNKNEVFKSFLEQKIQKYEAILDRLENGTAHQLTEAYKNMKEVYKCL